MAACSSFLFFMASPSALLAALRVTPVTPDSDLSDQVPEAFRKAASYHGLDTATGIRELRKALGLSQADFADVAGLSTPTLSSLETGKANPTVKTLNRLIRPYGFKVALVPIDRPMGAIDGDEPGQTIGDAKNGAETANSNPTVF